MKIGTISCFSSIYLEVEGEGSMETVTSEKPLEFIFEPEPSSKFEENVSTKL
jgi:hypothetical protein